MEDDFIVSLLNVYTGSMTYYAADETTVIRFDPGWCYDDSDWDGIEFMRLEQQQRELALEDSVWV